MKQPICKKSAALFKDEQIKNIIKYLKFMRG